MKLLNKISVLILGIIFLLSATGIVVYQTKCSCTGDEHTSLYVSPVTCENKFHMHHIHNEGGEEVSSISSECHECYTHTNECGCNDPDIRYFKLKTELTFDKARTGNTVPVHLLKPEQIILLLSGGINELLEVDFFYIEPPSIKTSLDFLIQIHQLKIAQLA